VRHLTQPKRLAIATTLLSLLAVTAVAAYAAADGGVGSQSTPIQQMTEAPGPGGLARANGLDPAAATTAFALQNGDTVSVVANGTAKCLIRRRGAATTGETCDTLAAIDQGAAIAVTDECGTSGRNLMEITGLAPESVATARLVSTSGGYRSSDVVNGAFKFDGTNPAPGGTYPTGVAWIARDGAAVGGAALPVHGNEFCIPTP